MRARSVLVRSNVEVTGGRRQETLAAARPVDRHFGLHSPTENPRTDCSDRLIFDAIEAVVRRATAWIAGAGAAFDHRELKS